MSQKKPHNQNQDININNSQNSGQVGQAGRDLFQIGHDYIQYIYQNTRSGNWVAVVIALIPILLFLYGVKATGDRVAEVVGVKPSVAGVGEPFQNNSLVQSRDAEIKKLQKRIEDLQQINETATKTQQQVEVLQKTLTDRQIELNKQKNLVQQQEQEIQALETQVKTLKDQLSSTSATIGQRSSSQEPPPGTAQKSWCLQIASIARQHASLGMDTSAMKASMEENNCGFWGISIP